MPEDRSWALPPRPEFATVKEYGQRFTDPTYWRPYIEEICRRHHLTPCGEIRSGLPGTYPVFIVDGRYAVKLFGDLFKGAVRFPVELEMYGLLATDREIPAPALVASGKLYPKGNGWPWPYIVTEAIAGKSLGEVEEHVSHRDRVDVCRFFAPAVRRIHSLRPRRSGYLRPSWGAFDRFLSEQKARCSENHRGWGSLPGHLVGQLDEYLPPAPELVNHGAPPCVLHCDLNADHVLGHFKGGRWRPTGIIDFADAMVGDRVYELVALHIGLFRCDKGLLRLFLGEYGFDEDLRRDFVRRAMSMTVLHEFDVLSEVIGVFSAAERVASLEELAALLWDLDQPGLRA